MTLQEQIENQIANEIAAFKKTLKPDELSQKKMGNFSNTDIKDVC